MNNNFINKAVAIFVLCGFIFFGACSTEKISTTAQFTKAIAGTVVNSDKASFTKFILSRDKGLELYQELSKIAQSDKQYARYLPGIMKQIASLKAKSDNKAEEQYESVVKSFDVLLNDAKNDGVDLKKARYGKLVKSTVIQKFLGRKSYDLFFTLLTNKLEYVIKLHVVIKGPSGMMLIDKITWQGLKK